MSTTCPACGVAVVPGYVRCPKCQAPLPGRRVQTHAAGGTAVEGGGGRLPILPIAGGAVVLLGLILYFVLGRSDAKPAPAAEPVAGSAVEETPAEVADPPAPVPVVPDDPTDPNRVDPNATARDLERALERQRLWSSVEVVGKDVYVTSGSCRDANMIPMVDAARAALRNAGLTRLRCMENSGAVVFERGL
jgi:hypothetical protein